MSNLANTLSKRLRAHTVSLPVTPTQRAVFSKHLNIDAMKQRAADWEPSLPLARLETTSKHNDGDDDGMDVAHMVTYSTFDPGATHPLLLSSALPMWSSSLAGSTSTTSSLDPGVAARGDGVGASVELQTTSTVSSLHHAIEVQQSDLVPAAGKFKPWPYSLPAILRPQVGTTYDLMYGDGDGADGGQMGDVKVGVLQKVFYGIPEPGRVVEKNEGARKGFWQKMVYGVQEEEQKEGKAGC